MDDGLVPDTAMDIILLTKKDARMRLTTIFRLHSVTVFNPMSVKYRFTVAVELING